MTTQRNEAIRMSGRLFLIQSVEIHDESLHYIDTMMIDKDQILSLIPYLINIPLGT